MMPNIEIEIGELVLHGFAPSDRASIGEAVQQELTRLLAEQGLASMNHSVEIARVNAGAFDVRVGTPPHAIGAQVALAIFGGFQK